MNSHDPLMIVLIKTYGNHRRFFYQNNFESFKLLVSWLTQEEAGELPVLEGNPPWYVQGYEQNQLANILKCSSLELYELCKEIYDE
jgi:hypothetical protein